MSPTPATHVAIIGAGPYGLSLAAHLAAAGVPFQIFGRPMQSWATQMPAGMKLKSDGFASNLYDPAGSFTLEDFCRANNRPYGHANFPIAVEDFVDYGREFARRFVPTLDTRNVAAVSRQHQEHGWPIHGDGSIVSMSGEPRGSNSVDTFHLTLEDGATTNARHLVLATGLSLFQHIPEQLAHLPPALVTHTTDHTTFEQFNGRQVTVLGRGASSLNAAALLHESGADVTVLSRHPRIHVHTPGSNARRSLYQRLRHPASPLGPGLRSWLSCTAPNLFRVLPFALRQALTYKHLGPSGGTALQGRVHGKVDILAGWNLASADLLSPEPAPTMRLHLRNPAGDTAEHLTSHIIAGTGFRYDLARLSFLAKDILATIKPQPTGAPLLDRHFQSTAPGIYFIGPSASTSFGQLLRFAAGAGYAAQRVTRHLLRTLPHAATGSSRPLTPHPHLVISTEAKRSGETCS